MGQKDPRVDAYIAKAPEFAKPILLHIREVVHAAAPDVEETLKWSMPTFTHHGILCGMAAFKEHAAFNLWKGALIVDSEKDRAAMGQFGRLTSVSDLPPAKLLASYIRKAVAINEAGVKAPKTRKSGLERKVVPTARPMDLAAALTTNAKARAIFEGFSPSHRREYIEWISEAKRDETRQRRLAQALEMLAAGRTRNWKYSLPSGGRAVLTVRRAPCYLRLSRRIRSAAPQKAPSKSCRSETLPPGSAVSSTMGHFNQDKAMVTREEIEGFLDKLAAEGTSYSEIQPGLWIVKPTGSFSFDVVVNYSPPVVVLRVKVMALPTEPRVLATLSHRLLELNATELVHGSYGIERDSIVLTEALELAHLDYDEFLASYEGMTLALASHLRELGAYQEAR